MHIIVYKSNFFITISESSGKVLFSKNSGSVGFKNIQKRSSEAFNVLLKAGIKFILSIEKHCIFLKFEGVKEDILQNLYKQLGVFKLI